MKEPSFSLSLRGDLTAILGERRIVHHSTAERANYPLEEGIMSDMHTPHVFVVDDESVIATTLAIILSQSGFLAEAFTSPTVALDKASERPPDLLISDVMMPEMTGVELAIQLRLAAPRCKVLLFSGQAATADLLEQARKSGHDFQLLSKPIHPADLLQAVRTL